MQIVAGKKYLAEEIVGCITAAGIAVIGDAVDGGFTEYVVSREAERFFRN
jgi:hypothetical protein